MVKNTEATSPIKNKVVSFTKTRLLPIRQFFVKNKAPLLLLTGLVVLSVIIYFSQNLLFLSPKNREIIGISLYSVSGFFLALDQILKNIIKDETFKRKKIRQKITEWLEKLKSKSKWRLSLFLLLVVFPVALIAILIFQAVSTGEKLPWSYIGGAIFFTLIAFNSYLYILNHVNRLFNKLGKRYQLFKDNSRNVLFGNIILLLISSILFYVFISKVVTLPGQVDMSQPLTVVIWHFVQLAFLVLLVFFYGFVVFPLLLLSFSYFVVFASVWLFLFFRQTEMRAAFWVLIFMFWTTGSIMLLTNAILS